MKANGKHTAPERDLPLANIEPWRNHRKRFDAGEMADLTASVRLHGVLQPILVWQLRSARNYRLIDGERHSCVTNCKSEGSRFYRRMNNYVRRKGFMPMAHRRNRPSRVARKDDPPPVVEAPPRSVQVASRGFQTAGDGMSFCEAMIQDVLADKVPYQRANTALRAYGSLLRTADMQQRYGNESENGKRLALLDRKDIRESQGA